MKNWGSFSDFYTTGDGILNSPKFVTPYLTLKSFQHRRQYNEQQRSRVNLWQIFIIISFVPLYMVIGKWFAYLYFPSTLTIFSMVVGFVGPILLGWMMLAIYGTIQLFPSWASKYSVNVNHFPHLQSVWLIVTVFSYNMSIVAICAGPQCDEAHQDWFKTWGCAGGETPQDGMPQEMMFASLFVPLLLSIVARGASWGAVCSSFLMSIGMIAYCIIQYDDSAAIGSFIFTIPFLAFVLYEHQRQRLNMFLNLMSKEVLIADNKRLADHAHEVEMRHMIGNVAHDLKTVNKSRYYYFNCIFISFLFWCAAFEWHHQWPGAARSRVWR